MEDRIEISIANGGMSERGEESIHKSLRLRQESISKSPVQE